jgi:hypothetical protein
VNTRRVAALIAFLTIGGCGESVLAPSPQSAIVGSWFRLRPAGEPPGSSTFVVLALSDGSLTGNGHWSGEAGPFGTLSADGVMIADSVRIDLTFFTDTMFGGGVARHATFWARLTSDSFLAGRLSYNGQPATDESFRKANLDLAANRLER